MARKKVTKKPIAQNQLETPHPWRLCPAGEHWVSTHPIRWLFQKQKLATSYLGKEATWEEAFMNYKGKLKSKSDNPEVIKQKKIFQKYLDRLEKCDKE